jgi:hypothetical protein
MRARLMAYCKGFPGSKNLREKFQHVSTLSEIGQIAEEHLSSSSDFQAAASNALENVTP